MKRWLPLVPPGLALTLVLMACGGGGGTDLLPTPTAPYGLRERVPLEGLAFADGLPDPTPLEAVRAFPALTFSRPVFLGAAPDASPWLYVVEQDGRILVFEDRDDATEVSTFLDLRGLVRRQNNEEGMLGLAFDPDWGPTGGAFYVHVSASSPRRSVIARYTASFGVGETPVADPASVQVVLEVSQPYGNHNGGMLAFGPDRMLYVALGDGGSANDPDDNGQDVSTLLGSILRLDVRGRETYAIPSDNPLVDRPGARGEIWAWGLRNPWRCAFDATSGALWVGDVGQGAREEITLVRAGGENHGWPVYEGEVSNRNPTGLPPGAFVGPVLDYPRSLGTSVIGGLVYRGTALASLVGAYVYGDYGSGRVWALVHDGASVVSNTEIASVGGIVSFGEDAGGELYAVSLSGGLWRFRDPSPTPPPPPLPATLSETGLFTDLATLTPNPGLIPYDVAAPLWSDGAVKRRWIGLAGTSRIGFRTLEPWAFPVGTVLVKHFELPLVAGDPSSAKRLETRVLRRTTDGWQGLTYRWNDAETEAFLLAGAETATYDVEDADAPGGRRALRWDYPSRSDCFRCHTEAAGIVLGVHTRQLNRAFAYPAATDNQLRAWDHVDLFDVRLAAPARYPAFPDPSDEAAPLEDRARAYLHANCASCHQPGGPAPGTMDLRAETPDGAMAVFDVAPTEGDLGIEDARRIAPGDPEASVLWERMRSTDPERMPPLGSRLPDEEAIRLIEAWILTR